MRKGFTIHDCRSTRVSALAVLTLSLCATSATAQSFVAMQDTESVLEQRQVLPLKPEQNDQSTFDAYVIGPSDSIQIELLDLPEEWSGVFPIGPDGTLYLPRLRDVYVKGLTIKELRILLIKKYGNYVHDPKVYVRPVVYRPIRVFVGGEVARPGYYTLNVNNSFPGTNQKFRERNSSQNNVPPVVLSWGEAKGERVGNFKEGFPTVFDAIRNANGITPYSDLAQIQLTRKRPKSDGGGRIRTTLNFIPLITEGNESQNIRVIDGDVVKVGKSDLILREQLLRAGQNSLSPRFMKVYVTGRVHMPGAITIPQGSSLNQAIAVAGGTRLLKGKVQFVRFTKGGKIDRRTFSYNPGASANASNNPVLTAGDLIRVQESPITATATILNEVTAPVVGVYSVYSLFKSFTQ